MAWIDDINKGAALGNFYEQFSKTLAACFGAEITEEADNLAGKIVGYVPGLIPKKALLMDYVMATSSDDLPATPYFLIRNRARYKWIDGDFFWYTLGVCYGCAAASPDQDVAMILVGEGTGLVPVYETQPVWYHDDLSEKLDSYFVTVEQAIGSGIESMLIENASPGDTICAEDVGYSRQDERRLKDDLVVGELIGYANEWSELERYKSAYKRRLSGALSRLRKTGKV